MAITQNDLEILKSEIMADTDDGGGLPTGIAVVDGVSNNLLPDVSDIDRLIGRVRLRKVSLAVKTANAELLQAPRILLTELPDNPNISVFFFKGSSFADRRSDAQDKIESYLAFGTKWAGHLLETQLTGQRVIQISLGLKDAVPAVGQPLVLVQNEGQSDEFYQYLRPLKVDTVVREFQRTVSETVSRNVVTIEFGDVLSKTFNGLTVPEFYQNASTSRRAILREARIADAAKYYSASRLAEPVVAMQSRQVRLESIFTQVVPSTQVETPILQRDPANQVATQARGDGVININQSVNVTPSTAFSLPSGIAVGTLSLFVGGRSLIDRDGQLVDSSSVAYASIQYGIGQITWYNLLNLGQTTVTGSYKPASEFTRVAQTDYQVVGDNAGYNYVRELGAEPLPNSLKITYTVGGNNYLVHDDGRGNLVDDDGNGRGTVQGKTVLLTTAAIPDAASYIIYSFGVDLDTVKYGEQALPPAYHAAIIDDEVVGDITITWGADKTATMSNGIITGDATGTYDGRELHIAPNETVAKDTEFTVSYDKLLDSMTSPINATYSPNSTDGTFTATIDMGGAIDGDISLRAELYDRGSAQVAVHLSSMGTGEELLRLNGVAYPTYATAVAYRSGNTITPQTGLSWYDATNGVNGQWKVFLVSSSLDKAAGTATFTIKVSRRKTVTDVVMAGGLNKKPLFTTTSQDENLNISTVQIYGSAEVGSTTEAATFDMTADKLLIAPPMESKTPVVSGSVFVDALGQSLRDDNGNIKNSTDIVGKIDYKSGVLQLTTWQAGQANTVDLKSMLRENDPVPLANLIFRTPVAPLKEASLQISAELADGTQISLSTDEQGNITGNSFAHGTVDFKAGVVALYFYERLGVTANPSVVNEPWYDANNIYTLSSGDNTQYINRPVYVKPDSIRYNAIAYSYLPLDKELIGLDPVRLPSDGRVPFVRKGDSIAITELKTLELPTNAPNDTFDLGFERLSDVNVVDANGLKVSFDYLDVDLDAGTLTLNGLLDMSFYTAPLTAKYRIMDIALVIETDISGRVTLSTPITHDYSTDAVFSSMLLAGDMQARAYNVFSQKSWSNAVWSDSLIGDAATSQLQVTNNPIVVTNRDAIEERWALVFTSQTAFRIIGQTVGEIGTGSTTTLTAPINPMTGYPYFTIPAAAWGTGWSANNVVRINTAAAKYPVWIGNAIQQHQGSSKDNYDFTIGYHANIDRERAV
ncbi:hypothetical protein [Psychrobacter piscatorii]|uniref:Uncharacterized protein n=1 Tax=Psychrobacter piscatorii TaxID=554343 RepID=A0A0T6DTQ7_9GAMM|nr:hypothetical protein [Psychrobacter piscatorii]KRU23301.1 hypothetical protein AS194_05065 [Psychrobacter piscatorii]